MKGGMTMLVAQVAVATGIAPNDLLDTPPDLFRAILKVLNDRTEKQNKARRRA
jgi:hypothetical protein